MSYKCDYCEKNFTSKVNLKKHVDTAKVCLNARGEEPVVKHICEYCGKIFTQKSNLGTHLKSCQKHKIYIESKNSGAKKLSTDIDQLNEETERYLSKLKLIRSEIFDEKIRLGGMIESKHLTIIEQLQDENDKKDAKIIELEKIVIRLEKKIIKLEKKSSSKNESPVDEKFAT
jgi:uncharacterized Zn-finger protein